MFFCIAGRHLVLNVNDFLTSAASQGSIYLSLIIYNNSREFSLFQEEENTHNTVSFSFSKLNVFLGVRSFLKIIKICAKLCWQMVLPRAVYNISLSITSSD